mmetsp:Transcript_20321/g.60706  ORF Transcript_20321/g.60706 Transcript_20321/m.60706 type:complete len:1397 (+) Transcript_20321:123-4313(+)
MQRGHGSVPGEHLGAYQQGFSMASTPGGWPSGAAPSYQDGMGGSSGGVGDGHMGTGAEVYQHDPAAMGAAAPATQRMAMGMGPSSTTTSTTNRGRVTLPPLRPTGGGGGSRPPAADRGMPRAVWNTSGSPYIPRRLGETDGSHSHEHGTSEPQQASAAMSAPQPGVADGGMPGHGVAAPPSGHGYGHGGHAEGPDGLQAPPNAYRVWTGPRAPTVEENRSVGSGDGTRVPNGGGSGGSGDAGYNTASAIRMAQIGAAFDSEVARFRQQCDQLHAERDALAAANAALHRRVEADAGLAASLDEVREAKSLLDQKLGVTTAQLEAQTTLAQQLQAANNELVTERAALVASKTRVESERDSIAEVSTSNRAEADARAEELAAQAEAAAAVQAALDTARAQIAELEAAKGTAETRAAEAGAALAEATAKIESDVAEAARLKEAVAKERADLEAAAADTLSRATEQHAAEHAKLQTELAELKTALERRHEEAVESAAKYATELATTRAKAEVKLAARTAELHALNAATETTHSELNGEVEALRRSSVAFTSEVDQLKDSLAERDAQIDALAAEVARREAMEADARHSVTGASDRLAQFLAAIIGATSTGDVAPPGSDAGDADEAAPGNASEAAPPSAGPDMADEKALADAAERVRALAVRAVNAEKRVEESEGRVQIELAAAEQKVAAAASAQLAAAKGRVTAVAKTLVGDIRSMGGAGTAPSRAAASLLERLAQLRAMCADGGHSSDEEDSWAWDDFNCVVVAVSDLCIEAVEAADSAVQAADPEGHAAAKSKLVTLQAKSTALLESIGVELQGGLGDSGVDDLSRKFSAADEIVGSLRAKAEKVPSLTAELDAARSAAELADHAESQDQVNRDREALARAVASEEALTVEVEALQHRLTTADTLAEQLQTEVMALEEESMVKTAQVRDFEGQVAQLTAEVTEAATKTMALDDALEAARTELKADDLRTQLEKSLGEIERLRRLLTDTNDARHNRLENENHGLRKAVDAANEERDAAVAARDRRAQSDAKDIAIERSIRVQLEREKEEIKEKMQKLIDADKMTEVLKQQRDALDQRVEDLEAELAEATARVTELEHECEEIGRRAAEEIEKRTAHVQAKLQELEDERDVALAKYAKAEKARREAAELARERGERIDDLERELRIAMGKIEKTDAVEELKAEKYRVVLDRYERTFRELGDLLNLELEPLQRDIIEGELDPAVRPKDLWDPHIDRMDKKLQKKIQLLHDKIADIPNQIKAVEDAAARERERQKESYEKIIEQMKTKLIRKEAMFGALTKDLDQLEMLKTQCDLEKKRVAQAQAELARIRDKMRQQRDEIEQLDTQLLEERALKEALVKRMEVANASKSVNRASRVTMVDPRIAVALRSGAPAKQRPRPPARA